jgi:DnaJ homolog subfamily C member 28
MLSLLLRKPPPTFARINLRRCISDNSASSKLFADAEREEREERLSSKPIRRYPELAQHENWTGEESMQDAVLRMLVDKYKPVRSGTIRTADEKLKDLVPGLNSAISYPPTLLDTIAKQTDNNALEASSLTPSVYSLKDRPLLPAVEGHKPWHTTFHAPTHSTPYIRYGSTSSQPSSSSITQDKKAVKKEKADRKRTQVAGRLTQARESTLDYRLGLKNAERRGQANPLTMKGWAGLVEERIEVCTSPICKVELSLTNIKRARQEGVFNVIKGRGKPTTRHIDERNPFIDREEFLMNRIVQRNGAAPPWVELQRGKV